MQREARKYLWDMQRAIGLIQEFTDGKTFADYQSSAMLRAAVEREFEIIGEAMTHLAKLDSALVARVSAYEQVIAFRNILIHGYDVVDDNTVWDVAESSLRTLSREIDALLKEG